MHNKQVLSLFFVLFCFFLSKGNDATCWVVSKQQDLEEIEQFMTYTRQGNCKSKTTQLLLKKGRKELQVFFVTAVYVPQANKAVPSPPIPKLLLYTVN